MHLRDPYGTARPCRWCEHYGGHLPGTPHAQCMRDEVQIQADGEHGCVFWVRAIGGDDAADERKARGSDAPPMAG